MGFAGQRCSTQLLGLIGGSFLESHWSLTKPAGKNQKGRSGIRCPCVTLASSAGGGLHQVLFSAPLSLPITTGARSVFPLLMMATFTSPRGSSTPSTAGSMRWRRICGELWEKVLQSGAPILAHGKQAVSRMVSSMEPAVWGCGCLLQLQRTSCF